MLKPFLLPAAVLLFTLPLNAQETDFSSLQSLRASDISAAAPEGGQKKWAVTYELNGRLTLADGKKIFNTPDGRLFELNLSDRKAARFNNRDVHIKAQAMHADDLGVLKVEDIELFNPAAHDLALPPYKAQRRRAELLSFTDTEITAANVRWHPAGTPQPEVFDWATARIKPELVKNVYFVKKPFAPEWIAAHSLFAFTFEPGGLTDSAGREASGLVLTIEAFLREGQSYGLVDGMKDKFGIVWLLTTWEDYSSRTALHDKARLVPYPVTLTREQKISLLKESVRLAAVNREGEYYDTITNNCTNNLVLLVNRALPENRRVKMWSIPYLIYNLRATMPVWVPGYLQGKGMLGAERPQIDASNYQVPLN